VGLIQPLAIDTSGKLIAGGHRLAVWALLAIDAPAERRAAFLKGLSAYAPAAKPDPENPSEPEAMAAEIGDLDVSGWKEAHPKGLVPVLVFDADEARTKNKALLREVAENEKRRGYTSAEVKALADRLKKAGFDDIKGRPEADQQPLRAELARILGRSSRQIRRMLNDPEVVKVKRRTRDRLSTQQRTIAALRAALADAAPVFAKDQKAAKIGTVASQLAALVKRYRVGEDTHRARTA